MSKPNRSSLLVAVSLLTAAMMMFEILQTVTLSLQVFAQNAFFVVSVSLLGMGFGGSVTTFILARRDVDTRGWLWASALGFGVSVIVVTAGISRTFSTPLLILLTVPPFALVGLFLALLFSSAPARASQVYFFDLIGSAVGCAGLVVLLNGVGDAAALVSIIAVLGCLSSIPLALSLPRSRLAASIALTAIAAASVPFAGRLFPFSPNENKHYGRMLSTPGITTELEWQRWSYLGRLDIVRPVSGIENFFYGESAKQALANGAGYRYLFASGDNWSYAIDFKGNQRYRDQVMRRWPPASPYAVAPARDTLVIGVGGGIDLFTALAHGVRSVTAAEINPLMVAALHVLGPSFWEGAIADPRITIHEMDGRTLAQLTGDEHFDIITLTAVDTGAGLAHGGLVLSESYLYTLEAFERYFALLRPGGVIFIHRPVDQLFRAITTASEALARRGVASPDRHFAVFGKGDWISTLVFKDPMSPAQADALVTRLEAGDFGGGIFYLPDGERTRNPFWTFFDAMRAGRLEDYRAEAPIDVSPVTDDRPFYYHLERTLLGSAAGELLFEILVWVSLLSALLLFVPLFRARVPAIAPRAVGAFVYFAGIGAGFILVEISLMQKLALYLGHPAYSVTVTLFAMLLFSGLGSLASSRILDGGARLLRVVMPVIAMIIAGYALFSGPLLDHLVFGSLYARAAVAVLLLMPGSFLMGMPLPTRIRLMPDDERPLVPWAWAVNAFASVIGSTAAMMLALSQGFRAVLLVAAACYLIALLGLPRRS